MNEKQNTPTQIRWTQIPLLAVALVITAGVYAVGAPFLILGHLRSKIRGE